MAAGVLGVMVCLSAPVSHAADTAHRKPTVKPAAHRVAAHRPVAHHVTAHKPAAVKVAARKPAAVHGASHKPVQTAAVGYKPVVKGFVQEGTASWYDYQGTNRRTASGHKPHETDLTAAHRSLPFNTKVRVTNLRNGRSVVVTINDRGPFGGSRIIDLNKRAASQIGLIAAGVGKVRIEKVVEVAEVPHRNGGVHDRG